MLMMPLMMIVMIVAVGRASGNRRKVPENQRRPQVLRYLAGLRANLGHLSGGVLLLPRTASRIVVVDLATWSAGQRDFYAATQQFGIGESQAGRWIVGRSRRRRELAAASAAPQPFAEPVGHVGGQVSTNPWIDP